MMKTVSITKSSEVELTLVFNEKTAYFSIISGNRTFNTSVAEEAIQSFHQECERLRARSLKALEDRYHKPWQNILSRFTAINKIKAKDFL